MTCPCEDKCAGKLPPKATEIVRECGPVLFHKVLYPASLGVPTDEELRALQYKNVLLEVEANKHVYLYSSDGVPTLISKGDIDPTEILEAISELQQSLAAETSAREEGDTNLQEQLTGLSDTVDEELNAVRATTTALQNDVVTLQGTTVQKDTAISADTSTVTVTKTTGELSADGTETAMPLPVASAEQAGVMNASTFSAVQENSENIDSILGGAITLSTIPADPTQEQLTDAWKTATGKTELVNRASIYDETNKLVWYYYSNASEWKSMPAGDAAVSVSIATNDTAGIVKGSTEDGQVAVEADGTMSLNGYDAINSNIENLQSEMPKLPAGMVYDFVSPAGANNPSTAENANITARVVETATGNVTSGTLMLPMASETQAGSITADNKQKLDSLPAITSIGENLELTDEGVLNASGGSEYVLPRYVMGSSTTNTLMETYNRTATGFAISTFYTDSKTGVQGQKLYSFPMASATYAGAMRGTDKAKLDSLLEIKSLNDSLELDENGQLSVVGGGGSATLYSEYGTNTDGALTQAFMSEKLNSRDIVLGGGAKLGRANSDSVVIGPSAQSYNSSVASNVVIGPYANAQKNNAVAIGNQAVATGLDSVAIGAASYSSREEEFSIGAHNSPGGAEFTRYLANVTAAALDTDATNLAQVRSAAVGEVLYSGTDAEATITLTSPVSQYEKVEIIGSWTMSHTDTTTPLQVIGHWHLNDQDNSRTFQLRAVDVDPTANQKTEVVETWSFTGSTTLQMISGAQISGELTDQVMEALEAPQIIITKVIGIKAI